MAKKISAVKAVKKSAAPKKPAEPAKVVPAGKLSVIVDYPREGDLVRPGHYAVRIDALGAAEVQVKLDGTDWLECREAVGFFWYDWSPQKPGPVVVAARARKPKGRWIASPGRACVVEA